MSCLSRSCGGDFFKCSNGRCIPTAWRCDGDQDCPDSEDEPETCEDSSATCDPTYFRCNTGKCIPGRWRCDYDEDCSDGSDEVGCQAEEFRVCSQEERPCHNGRCVHTSQWCDGIPDCEDRTDEMFCHVNCSSQEEFQCKFPPYCIFSEWRCDGERDCSDGSDEADCPRPACSPGEFSCLSDSSECVSSQWRCDGEQDCADGSDEDPDTCSKFACEPNRFRCDNNKCVLWSSVCDQEPDCSDGSDEAPKACALSGACPHPKKSFRCGNTKCISSSLVCDGNNDCNDGTDEADCPEQPPCTFGACSQICQVKRLEGGEESSNVSLALCLCGSGYQQTDHKKHCKVIGSDPVLLLANENNIRHLNPSAFHKMVDIYSSTGHTSNDNRALNKLKINSIDVFFNESLPVVFMSLRNNGTIVFVRMEHGRRRRDLSQTTGVMVESAGRPHGLAVDWVNRNLYWVDTELAEVTLINIDSRLQLTVISSQLGRPRDIAVDPDSAKLFISDCGLNPKILVARLDGTHLQPLVESKIRWPSSLSLDYPARRLYWTDLKAKTIETIQIDGRYRKLVTRLEPKLGKPHKIEVFEDVIYFTTFKINKILKMNKFGKGNISEIAEEILAVTDLTILQENKHDDLYIAHPCQNHPCKKFGPGVLCVSVPSDEHNLTFKCLCAAGWRSAHSKCVKTGRPAGRPPEVTSSCEAVDCHRGTCELVGGRAHCLCEPHYTGQFCDTYICSGYCRHGLCHFEKSAQPGQPDQPRCFCSPGYSGERCEISREQCEAVCHDSVDPQCFTGPWGEVRCRCEEPWRGRCGQCEALQCGGHCQVDMEGKASCEETDCESWECQHNSSCVMVSAGGGRAQPECQCLDQLYEGRQCELDKCEYKFCAGGGRGHREDGRCVCTCPPALTGPRCEDRLTDSTLCGGARCEAGGVCMSDGTCSCPPGYSGQHCQVEEVWHQHCLNGGTPGGPSRDSCHCPPGYRGFRCQIVTSQTGNQHNVDNATINSLTVTIVSVSMVSLALVGAVVYLVYFTLHKRRLTSPFRHRRMNERGGGDRSNNMEFANRMFLQDDEEEDQDGALTMEELEPSRNFVNPVYETMFQVSAT